MTNSENTPRHIPQSRSTAGLGLTLKAWHVFAGEPQESSLLVFAKTPARARYMACKRGLWDYGDYTYTRARRAPTWDKYADREWVAEQNEDLPKGADRT